MDAMGEPIQCRIGDEVFGCDDHKIGKVAAYDPHFLTVERGLLHKSAYYIPMSAVNTCSEGKIYLHVRKDEVAAQGWDTPPLLDTEAGGRTVAG